MLIVLIVLGIFALACFVLYNSLVQKKNQVTNVFATIDALLKKRYDLIPNLVGVIKNYMQYEKGVLVQITELRSKAVAGDLSDDEKMGMENKISKLMGDIRVAVENYPDLKANQNFLGLQASLNEIEEQLSAARRAYNAAITDYNNALQMYPTNIMAALMNYKTKAVFEAVAEEKKNVCVDALFKDKA